MDLNDYQQAARRTAIYPAAHRVIYPALGLASEAGARPERSAQHGNWCRSDRFASPARCAQ